ncbi:MAG: HmuY family protein [Candidatus Symbiothrix sp.]|nr:HmuY family protein [Candidatus Symbiothrix sp.]
MYWTIKIRTHCRAIAVVCALLGWGLTSCNKDYLFDDGLVPKSGTPLVVDCSSYTHWYFFSFEEGKIIGSCDAGDAVAGAQWRTRTDWDLAFHRQNIQTNSGVSGVGEGGILKLEQPKFDFDAVTVAPADGYQTDVADSIVYDMSQMVLGEIGYVQAGLAQPVKNWATLHNMMASDWRYEQSVFIVRTAEKQYAKIRLWNFKNEKGESGTISMQYVYPLTHNP